MHKAKIAVIGCGHWGKNLVRNFKELGALKYICDANKDHADEMAKNNNVISATIDEVLKSDVDGVVIAAPAEQHYDLAKAVLKAGKNVFVEKPLSLEVEEAKELCALSKKMEKILMVGHLLQYHSGFLKIKELVQNGKLGKLQYIYSNRLNLGKFRNEENILWSFAPHDISMILSLAGGVPDTVFATGSAHLNKNIQDITTTHLTFKNGIQSHIFVSWLHPFKEQKLVVVGERGMAVFDDGLDWSEKVKLYPHKVNWVNGMPQPQKAEFENISLKTEEPLKLECSHFLECIDENKIPRTDGEEGLRVLKVLDASQKSLLSGESVNIKEIEKSYFVHETSCVDSGCTIGESTKIWHYSHILSGTKIGKNCTVGQNVMIGPDVVVGNNCKIQNNVSLYKGVTIEDGVFLGPSCVFTNVKTPRAEVNRSDEFLKTHVGRGATIGANATIVCGVKLGKYCTIGAGAVVTKDVPDHALIVGNPGKQVGWVSHSGEVLGSDFICPSDGNKYNIKDDNLVIEPKIYKLRKGD